MPLSRLRTELVAIIRDLGLTHQDPPVQLASGDLSRHFIDTKLALARGSHLELASRAVIEVVKEMDIEFDAVGGLTMGADQIAHGVAILADVEWFSVRKEAKERGTKKRIEGAVLGAGKRVLLVEDVVTRGGSITDALGAINKTGAPVVAAISIVDRGPFGRLAFRELGIRYEPLVTYEDLGIEPVGEALSAEDHIALVAGLDDPDLATT